jgi:hypothetical protein
MRLANVLTCRDWVDDCRPRDTVSFSVAFLIGTGSNDVHAFWPVSRGVWQFEPMEFLCMVELDVRQDAPVESGT